jgi:PBP1b-binding outer membrane lipoprotein LpoB
MTQRILVLLIGAFILGGCNKATTPPPTETKTTQPTTTTPTDTKTNTQTGNYDYMKGKSGSPYF